MLKINFEFRKGIFFIRFLGVMNEKNYGLKKDEIKDLLLNNKFKYIVINTNYIKKIDLNGLNYIIDICYLMQENESNLIICDKTNLLQKLTNNRIPNIKDELEVL